MERIVFLCVSRQPFCVVIKLTVPPSIESAREEPLHDALDQTRIAAATDSRGRHRQLEIVLVPFGATAFTCALTILFSEMLHVCSPVGQGLTRDPERLPQSHPDADPSERWTVVGDRPDKP